MNDYVYLVQKQQEKDQDAFEKEMDGESRDMMKQSVITFEQFSQALL